MIEHTNPSRSDRRERPKSGISNRAVLVSGIVSHACPAVAQFAEALLIVLVIAGHVCAFGPPGVNQGGPFIRAPMGKSSLIEGRFGYLFGFNELLLRDGDNANIPPTRRDIDVSGIYFELQGETFVSRDLAVRLQGWINVPEKERNEFYGPQALSWQTKARYLGGDLAAVYHFGLGRTPYSAGIIAGYRYQDLDLRADRKTTPDGIYYDHTSVHIPHLGVYYAHSEFLGALARLDILVSPLTLSLVDGRRHGGSAGMGPAVTEIDGHAITGIWFESFFQMALPISESGMLGAFTRYNYLELSGGATVQAGLASTRFSMDSSSHILALGITAAFTF